MADRAGKSGALRGQMTLRRVQPARAGAQSRPIAWRGLTPHAGICSTGMSDLRACPRSGARAGLRLRSGL
jgi:hypothetical protein